MLPVPPEPPKEAEPLSKEELKAQRKKDRLILNMLKLRIQPIMDQIKQKYKKFRSPIVEPPQISYLYEEEDPDIITTDLPLEQRQEQAARFRPYELGHDENGEPGLIDQATKRFLYNMDIVTIEKRLSNGYYKRPKDFLSDIKKLTRDAKTIDDEERIMKANELLANVEVDIDHLFEVSDPAFTAECEALWQRETQREQEKVNKARQLATTEGRELQPIRSNVPPHDIDSSTEQSSGPIVLGGLLTNGTRYHPITPQRQTDPNNTTNGEISDLSNLDGSHPPQSNGTSHPSNQSKISDPRNSSQERPSTDRETHSSWAAQSAQTRPAHSYTGGFSTIQQRMSHPQSLSQKSVITPLAEGSNPSMYVNEASTTNSSNTKPPSGESHRINTQSSHSQPNNPDFSRAVDPTFANSQLPETQASPFSSQERTRSQEELLSRLEYLPSQTAVSADNNTQVRPSQSQHLNNTPPVPPFPRSTVNSLLNNPAPPTAPQTTHNTDVAPSRDRPQIITDLVDTQNFHNFVVTRTSACSVEQLEQVYSALMGEIWRTRGMWNRVEVTNRVRKVLMDCLEDMESCQNFLPASFEGQM